MVVVREPQTLGLCLGSKIVEQARNSLPVVRCFSSFLRNPRQGCPLISDRFGGGESRRGILFESLYRQIWAADPRHFNALHYLGVLAGQTGRNDLAIDLMGRARDNYQ